MATVHRIHARTRTRPHQSIQDLAERHRIELVACVQKAIQADPRTREQIARAAGISTGTISNIAIGNTRWPRYTTLFPLCAVLGLRIRATKEPA